MDRSLRFTLSAIRSRSDFSSAPRRQKAVLVSGSSHISVLVISSSGALLTPAVMLPKCTTESSGAPDTSGISS